MGPPGAFRPLAVHFLGTSPALWRAEDDHRPPRACCILLSPCLILDGLNLGDDGIQRGGPHSVNSCGLDPLVEVPLVAIADHAPTHPAMPDPSQRSRTIRPVTLE